MSKINLMQRLAGTLTVLEGAREAAVAVSAQRKPTKAALKKMGIQADAFDSIQFFGMTR
jgi:hypothetical protein